MRGPVVVIGAGVMGAGIAGSLLQAGEAVAVVDVDPSVAAERTGSVLRKAVERSGGADWRSARERLSTYAECPPGLGPALVIEAVPEDAETKAAVLRAAEDCYPELPLLATNTSALSITQLAEGLGRPDRFCGMHFFNPVPASLLIEVVVGRATSASATATAVAWAERLGKTAIVAQDSPGFVSSRLGIAIGLEAMRMVEEGVAEPSAIDTAMVLGYRFPIGPLRLTDLVGLDVRLAVARYLETVLGDRFHPPQILEDLVTAGKLGKKCGEGFYQW